jgi:predicted phage terminase large subunit-like protein
MLHAWMWLHWPSWSLCALTASPKNALRDAVYTRNLLTSDWYQRAFEPEWELSGDQNAKGNFWNSKGGFRLSAGYSAQVVGGRTDCLLIDDPHDPQKIEGPERETVLERWNQVLGNRVNDQRSSFRLIIMQRLHEADLTGHVLQQDGGAWEHLVLPMVYEPGGVCDCQSCKRGSAIGFVDPRATPEANPVIHPSRFPAEVRKAEEKRLGSYGVAGQFQQRPAPKGGGMFTRLWWRFHALGGQPPTRDGAPVARPKGCREDPPVATPLTFERVLLSIDANFKNVTSSDPASLWVVGALGPKRYVLARRTAHGFLSTVATARELVKAWHTHGVLIETAANGQAVVETLSLEVSGVVPVQPLGGKAVRAAAMQPAAEAGDWLFLDGADWLEEVVGQFASFPRVAHDDDVDAASQLHAYLLSEPFALSY